MYDFWYTLGVATIDPTMLTPLKEHAKFTDVERVVNETIGGVPQKPRKGPHTGLVERNATTNMRLAIFAALKKFSSDAPPVGHLHRRPDVSASLHSVFPQRSPEQQFRGYRRAVEPGV